MWAKSVEMIWCFLDYCKAEMLVGAHNYVTADSDQMTRESISYSHKEVSHCAEREPKDKLRIVSDQHSARKWRLPSPCSKKRNSAKSVNVEEDLSFRWACSLTHYPDFSLVNSWEEDLVNSCLTLDPRRTWHSTFLFF